MFGYTELRPSGAKSFGSEKRITPRAPPSSADLTFNSLSINFHNFLEWSEKECYNVSTKNGPITSDDNSTSDVNADEFEILKVLFSAIIGVH